MSIDSYRDEWDAMAEVTRHPLPAPAEHDEATALRAEIERLRGEADLLRTAREATRAYADRVEAEVLALRGERAAVVTWLRAQRGAAGSALVPSIANGLATSIERGEHRREEDE